MECLDRAYHNRKAAFREAGRGGVKGLGFRDWLAVKDLELSC